MAELVLKRYIMIWYILQTFNYYPNIFKYPIQIYSNNIYGKHMQVLPHSPSTNLWFQFGWICWNHKRERVSYSTDRSFLCSPSICRCHETIRAISSATHSFKASSSPSILSSTSAAVGSVGLDDPPLICFISALSCSLCHFSCLDESRVWINETNSWRFSCWIGNIPSRRDWGSRFSTSRLEGPVNCTGSMTTSEAFEHQRSAQWPWPNRIWVSCITCGARREQWLVTIGRNVFGILRRVGCSGCSGCCGCCGCWSIETRQLKNLLDITELRTCPQTGGGVAAEFPNWCLSIHFYCPARLTSPSSFCLLVGKAPLGGPRFWGKIQRLRPCIDWSHRFWTFKPWTGHLLSRSYMCEAMSGRSILPISEETFPAQPCKKSKPWCDETWPCSIKGIWAKLTWHRGNPSWIKV